MKEVGLAIDENFIRMWHPRYDETEDDEEDYRRILAKVTEELQRTHTISKCTLQCILDWKSPRLRGIVKLKDFRSYTREIAKCLNAPDEGKLAILDDLYGIGVPVASTILHFMYPDSYPIMDVRTVEVLNHAGYLESRQRDQKRYVPFRSTILALAQQCRRSLREIDRALFAYDKKQLGPKLRRMKEAQLSSEGTD